MTPSDRLILALDVPTVREALSLVDALDNVSFFKIGWQLFMTGEALSLLDRLRSNAKKTFLDLKVPGDIGNTIASVVEQAVALDVQLLTLSDSVPPAAIQAAKKARGSGATPKFLIVPVLSSMDASDLKSMGKGGDEPAVDDYIVSRAAAVIAAGCDGVIASGSAIRKCRAKLPSALIVSPGIRPAWAAADDHKRHTTPAEAIQQGADYLVVGRPIYGASNPREAAERVIAEIQGAGGASPG